MSEADRGEAARVDRRIQYCHFRIQQAISLCDDELERLTNRLTQLKSDILTTRMQIGDTDRQIAELRDAREGDSRRRRASLEVSLSRMRSAHYQRAHDLQHTQAAEIERLQTDFEAAFASHAQTSQELLQGEEADLDCQAQKIEAHLELLKGQIESVVAEDESAKEPYEEVNSAVLEELQVMLQSRVEERLANLSQSKAKLGQCIDVIERMERDHKVQVDELRSRIQARDERYQSDLDAIRTREDFKVARLKHQLVDIEAKLAKLAKAARHLTHDNQAQLQQTMSEIDRLKTSKTVGEVSSEKESGRRTAQERGHGAGKAARSARDRTAEQKRTE
jgi:chromosome segregation ATPase